MSPGRASPIPAWPTAPAYYYTVTAVNAVGISAHSGEASATPQATVPSAPLAADGLRPGTPRSAWPGVFPAADGGSPITGYNVYRGTSAGGESGTPVASNITGRSFTDTTVVNGTAYFYTVAAVNGVGVSAKSAEVSATPQPASAAAFVRRVGSATASSRRRPSQCRSAPPALPPVTR